MLSSSDAGALFNNDCVIPSYLGALAKTANNSIAGLILQQATF